MENDWLIDSGFRDISELDGDFSNDSKISLMTKDKFMDIWAWTNSRRFLVSLESTNWSGDFYSYNNVINISITIFLHSWSSRTNPTSKRWEFNWIWLMATTDSKFGEFFLHILSNDTSFDACHHVVFINPFNFIHSGAVNRNDCSFFTLLTHQTFSDICSPE